MILIILLRYYFYDRDNIAKKLLKNIRNVCLMSKKNHLFTLDF